MDLNTDCVFFLNGSIMIAMEKAISSDRGTTTTVYKTVFHTAL